MNQINGKQIVSVRTLVEFVLRSGSIDNRFVGFDRAQLGSRLHRRIQKEAGGNYQAEVFFKDETIYQGETFIVQGRADGIIKNDTNVIVDEIKSTGQSLDTLEEGNPVHWAQAKCYAWFAAKQDGLDQVTVRLTYVHTETKEIRKIEKSFPADELEVFYLSLLDVWLKWAKMAADWQKNRNASIGTMDFPYPSYRAGQRKMAVAVYQTIKRGERFFCQAPTGIGKTLSALFPALKSLNDGYAEKIYYATAKTTTRKSAENAVDLMRGKGLRLRSVTLTAKDKTCFLEKRNCNPEACPYAAGYYDKINTVLWHCLEKEDNFSREVIESVARREMVCPFELSLDLSEWCDVTIGDYNYLFDPIVALGRFTENANETVFLIDEAHNLVDRSRAMYSASLNKKAFLSLKKALSAKDGSLYQSISKVNEVLLTLRKDMGEKREMVSKKALQELNDTLAIFAFGFEAWQKKHKDHAVMEEALSLYFDVRTYLTIAALYDDHYITMITRKKTDVTVTQLCLDASAQIDSILSSGTAAILFSATLSPVSYFRQTLGGTDAHHLLLPSPFVRDRFLVLAAEEINTKFAHREETLEDVAELIQAFVSVKQGHYIVFFPSYAYMEAVMNAFKTMMPKQVKVIVQSPEMSESEREDFIAQFTDDPSEALVAFCITGGFFGEGIDLKGDSLIGAVIVGVGLPQICSERNLLSDYYTAGDSNGFDFAYRHPGMIRVMQAMGRVIRDEHDKGAALLIDSRFGESAYRNLLPEHLKPQMVVKNTNEIIDSMTAFWKAE